MSGNIADADRLGDPAVVQAAIEKVAKQGKKKG